MSTNKKEAEFNLKGKAAGGCGLTVLPKKIKKIKN